MSTPFSIDETSEGESGYGGAVHRTRFGFMDPADETITKDPIRFAIEAFRAATTGTQLGYVRWASPIAWARLYRPRPDGRLFAYVRIMTRPIEPLMMLDGWAGWDYDEDGLHEPSEERIAEVPVMCTSTLLQFSVPPERLHVPQEAPSELTVRDATASIACVVELLNERVRPVIDQLEAM